MQFTQLKRREFITLVVGAAAWPLVARAQQARTPVLGFVSFAQREATLQASWYQAFHDGLRELGWIPGSNVSIEYRFADNDPGRLAALAHELVGLKPDAIFVPTRPALPTVKDATTTVPIVFVSLGDPIAEGWVASLARPDANLTGVAGPRGETSRIIARIGPFARQGRRAVESGKQSGRSCR
jgi:putative ABC transport system substrate-binding protein